ncbi:MAG: hypothetical protein JWN70_6146 [Planctomycetaceae bacterium]|nr:hypothetical protein [Planctomycetaceae bacterium]
MMLDAPSLTIDCPGCQHPLGLRKNLVGSALRCKKCNLRVQVAADGQVAPVADSAGPGHPPPAGPSEPQPELLEWLEDLFIKMIRGIFKFTFIHIPCEVYRTLVHWYPTLVRTFRVAILGATWLFLASAPLIWILCHEWFMNRIGGDGSTQPIWYYAHQLAWNAVFYLYTGFAIVGSGWGVFYVKRLRRKLKEKGP